MPLYEAQRLAGSITGKLGLSAKPGDGQETQLQEIQNVLQLFPAGWIYLANQTTLTISNTGGGTLYEYASENASWLNATPASGTCNILRHIDVERQYRNRLDGQ